MLLWIEGFETYGTSNGSFPTGLDVVYSGLASQTGTIIVDGRTTGKAVAIGQNPTARFIETPSFGNVATWIIGFAFKPGVSFDNTDTAILSVMDSGSPQFTLNITASGQLQLRRGAVNGTTLGTSTATLSTNSWHFIELTVTVGNSGSYEVRLNGVNILSGSADTQNTANAQAQTCRFFGAADSSSDIRWAYDDIYICDSSGSVNNDFLGSRKVVAIFPDGAGDSTDFTPNSGSNYQAVDDAAPDGDTSYVESSTPGHRDLYTFGNASLTNIAGVQQRVIAKETDANPFSVSHVCKSGSTVDVGAGQPIGGTSYVNRFRILEEDPDTSAPWDQTGLNAAQFGIEVD